MKSNYLKLALVLIWLALIPRVNAQPGCPTNFPYTESFCFTNNSGTIEHGAELTEGCQIEICVKIKPKLTCYPECNYVSQDGWYSTYCTIIDVGSTNCIYVPSTTNPITDCWDVEITMKIVGHSQPPLESDVNDITIEPGVSYSDDCEQNSQDFTVIKRLSGSGFNFDIRLRRFTGG